ncbi:MAG: AsmA family protein, partial [Alphaproteobacteria bacterium]|nr:AsmA family protein [Alphaproteobacteria bacterium]
MKKLLIGFGALVVLVVAAAFIIPAFVPVDVYKAQLEERVRAATGRDFAIRGPVSLTILPSLAVRADDAALGNVPGAAAAQMIAIKRLDVEVALMPLLSGRIEVTRLVLTEPQIALEIDRNGRPNWAMGAAGAPPAAPPAAPSAPAARAPAPPATPTAPADPLAGVPDVALGDVRIVNGRFDFRDARTGQRLELAAMNLTLSLPGLDQPVGITGDATWNGEKVTVELRTPAPRGLAAGRAGPVAVKIDAAPLRLDVAMNVDPANPLRSTGDVTLAAPAPARLAAWLAPLATIDQASLRDVGAANLRLRISAGNELAVTGDVQFRNEKLELSLDGVSLAAIIAQRATPVRGRLGGVAGAQAQLDGTFTPAPAPTFAGSFNLAAPSLSRLAALVGRADALAVLPGRDVTAITLQGRLGAAMELNVTGRATLNGEALTLAIESGPLAQAALARVPLTLRVQGQPLTLAFNGQLERSDRGAPPPAVGTLELAVPSVRRLAAWAGQPLPDTTAPGQLNALSFQGRVSLAPTRVTMTDARFALDQIRSTGNLEADLSGRRPKLSGRLAVDRLDLNPYVGAARSGSSPAAAPAAGANQAAPRAAGGEDQPIDASALRAFDMDLSLTLAGLAAQAIELGRTALRIQLDEGLLTANVAEMGLYNGQLRGTTRLDARQAALGVHSQMNMAGVRALPLLRATSGFERFEGTINAEWNIQGAGRSQQAIMRA